MDAQELLLELERKGYEVSARGSDLALRGPRRPPPGLERELVCRRGELLELLGPGGGRPGTDNTEVAEEARRDEGRLRGGAGTGLATGPASFPGSIREALNGLEAHWSPHPGWIVLRDLTSGESAELRARDCPGWAVREADDRRRTRPEVPEGEEG